MQRGQLRPLVDETVAGKKRHGNRTHRASLRVNKPAATEIIAVPIRLSADSTTRLPALHAQTPLQADQPPAPSLGGSLVHAAVPPAAGPSGVLDAAPPPRHAGLRSRAVDRLRAYSGALPARDAGRAGVATERARRDSRHLSRQS